MAQGDYTHPSYLTRQQLALQNVTAGAAGTSAPRVFVSNVRVRNAVAVTAIAGTIGTNVSAIIQATGTGIIQYPNAGGTNVLTTSTGLVAIGTCAYGTAGNTAFVTSTSGDMNAYLPAGSVITVKNGADATAVTQVTLETYLDPSATWTGPPGN